MSKATKERGTWTTQVKRYKVIEARSLVEIIKLKNKQQIMTIQQWGDSAQAHVHMCL